MAPIALTIAGSKSGSDAGILADLKTFSALQVHGAGCSLSAAITAGLALEAAVRRAHGRLRGALGATSPDGLGMRSGAGHGPVHHFQAVWRDG